MKNVILALMAVIGGVAAAKTVYVDVNVGSDSYDGSSATVTGATVGPKKTIQAAIDAAAAGDTVLVAPGVYGEEQGYTSSSTASQNCRVFISKSLTLKSSVKGGAAIVGSLDATTPVTAISVTANAGQKDKPVEINGFVIRNCRNSSKNSNGAVIRWNGDGAPSMTNEIGPFVVDCVISNCQSTVAGILSCVNAVRVHIRNCTSSSNAFYLYNANAAFCVFAGANNKGINIPADYMLVNCTIVGGEHACSTGNLAQFYNVLITGGGNANTYLSKARNCILLGKPSTDYNENTVVYGSTYNTQQIASPIFADYRPLVKDDVLCPNAKACDWGSTNHLALLPERFRFVDFEGNAFTHRDGKIHAGAVQTACAPTCGFYTTDTKLRVNAAEFYAASYNSANQTYLGTNDWPRVYELSATNDHLFAYWAKDDETWRFPNRAGKALYVPQNGRLTEISAQAASKVLYVDCDADAGGDGTKATPYQTIQEAINAAGSSYANIYVAPGVYNQGSSEWSSGVTPRLRVKVSNSKRVRVVATSSTEPTVIKGAADTTENADEKGNGPNAIRAIRAQGDSVCCFSGFTITDGHTDNSSAAYNSYKNGGAFMAESGKHAWLMDCIVTGNASAESGAAMYGGKAARCVFTNNVDSAWFFNYTSGDIICHLIGCVVAETEASTRMLVGSGMKIVHSTFYTPDPAGRVLTSDALGAMFNTLIVNNKGATFGTSGSACCAGNVFENSYHSKTDKKNTGVDAFREGASFLVDPAHGDWHVATASAALGNGCAWNGLGDTAKWPDQAAYTNFYSLLQHDFDGHALNFVNGKPTVGAYQMPTKHAIVTSVNRAEHVTLTPAAATNYVDLGASVTVTATPKDGRTVTDLFVNGESVVGTSYTVTLPADAGALPAIDVKAFVNTNWYVDAVNGSDDAHHGWTESDAFLTLSNTMALVEAGDVVTALPGVYRSGTMIQAVGFIKDNGTTIADNTNLPSRVVIPSGVSLVSRDGAETTVIEGVRPDGNFGAGAVRCVYMMKNATLRGFTVTGGSTFLCSTGRTGEDYSSGGIFCAETQSATPTVWVTDCVISNNYSHINGGATTYGGFRRCRFFDNRSRTSSGASLYPGCVIACVYDRNWGTEACCRPYRAFGCTFGANNLTWLGNTGAATEADATSSVELYQFRNCLFLGGSRCKLRSACDCIVPSEDFLYSGRATYLISNITVAAVSVDAAYAPAYDSAAQNKANMDWVRQDELEGDVYGNPRRANGGMDIGAVETDWKPRYASDLSARRVTVTAADWNVVEDANRRVQLNDGTSLACTLTLPENASPEFAFTVGDGATLTVSREGQADQTFAAGSWTLPLGTYAATEQFRFSVAGGTATLTSFKVNRGMVLMIR